MQKFKSVGELVRHLRPEKPVYCIRKESVSRASVFFQKNFPGKVLYAVKTNPHKVILKKLVESGITSFDIASIKELETVKLLSPDAKCYYMNTVKSREDIKEAYFKYNVKTFSLDAKDELIKIIDSTSGAKDLELFIRLSVSNEHAEIDLSKKFGAPTSEAIGLLRLTKQYAKKIGLSFHVGSQCMHPISYSKGIHEIGNVIKKTKIYPDYINVGGGFPTIYPDLVPQSLDNYFDEIKKGFENLTSNVLKKKDQKKLLSTDLKTIKSLIENYQIIQEEILDDIYTIKVSMTFNRDLVSQFFNRKNIVLITARGSVLLIILGLKIMIWLLI